MVATARPQRTVPTLAIVRGDVPRIRPSEEW